MPELPEVEIMARNLHEWLKDRVLMRAEVYDKKWEGIDWSSVVRRSVTQVTRRGKYAVIWLQSGPCIVLHYRMTGKTVLDPHRQRKARLRLVTDGHTVVSFIDPRRFGTVDLVPAGQLERFFNQKRLGPEPWPERRDGAWWFDRIGNVRSSIKVAMMRQDRIAGLGNIAASESLFRACIHPSTLANQLKANQWDAIADAVHGFIDHTIRHESGDEIQYVNQGGEGSFFVYGHAGRGCPTCGTVIERETHSGRSTFFCPSCQSLP